MLSEVLVSLNHGATWNEQIWIALSVQSSDVVASLVLSPLMSLVFLPRRILLRSQFNRLLFRRVVFLLVLVLDKELFLVQLPLLSRMSLVVSPVTFMVASVRSNLPTLVYLPDTVQLRHHLALSTTAHIVFINQLLVLSLTFVLSVTLTALLTVCAMDLNLSHCSFS